MPKPKPPIEQTDALLREFLTHYCVFGSAWTDHSKRTGYPLTRNRVLVEYNSSFGSVENLQTNDLVVRTTAIIVGYRNEPKSG